MRPRTIQPELLDTLSPADPRAIRSRRDLRRVNSWMRNHLIMARELRSCLNGSLACQLTDLGAGDGRFLLDVAHWMSSRRSNRPDVNVTLLDFQPNVSPETLRKFAMLGWQPDVVVADVFQHAFVRNDVFVANLFLHHFEADRLKDLFGRISQHADCLIAIEPRRTAWPLFCSRLLWAIGCNDVTRHDAVASVRAGFAGYELSALWPDRAGWQLFERSVGPFSHIFIARKITGHE